ncbi:YkvA family protein [Mycolicibacterium aichiense]|uniref:YkvA family protein n=1 Tax=Mycolicibacterium aichiense TaxID=1799 RepID=UPI003D66F064
MGDSGLLATALVVAWLVLAITLWVTKPDQVGITDLLRLLPDTVRLLKRLAADRQLPRRIRVVLAGVLIFLASPIDLIPDFIPVLGYADDVIITALALRWVTRTAEGALARHWPGTPDGLAALRRLCRLPEPV